MLQKMRENFTGTFALVILGVIAFSFVFFGLNYSFIGSNYVAKVDGEEINAGSFEQSYRDAIQQNPQWASLPPDQRLILRRSVLDNLINEQLIENYLNDNGYRISDEQVMAAVQQVPEFQLDGRFDMETYRLFLLERGMEPTSFEALQRARLRQGQLQLALGATAMITPAEYRRYLNLFAEQRVVTVASIDETAVTGEVELTDDMIAEFYTDNPGYFLLPESADIEYVEIRRDAVAEEIAVSEDELLEFYEDSKSRYLQDEQRRARHILFTFDDDEAAAEAEAAAVFARLQAGESFADLAAEFSDDGGTATQGGDLGSLTRSQLPGELGSSIFSLNEGDIDGPLQGDFGFHIVRLDEILEPGPLPLDQVRGELLSELRLREADDRFRDLERGLSDALFDSTDIEGIAAATGLEAQSVAGFTRNGAEPFGANQAAIDAVFQENVLNGGQVSDIIELDANRSAVFKVARYNEATRQPIEEVRDQIVALLTSQEADQLMVARAEQMLEAVAGGEDFGQAAEAAGLSVAPPQIIARNSQEIDQAMLFDAFAAGKPTADAPVTRRVRAMNGGYAVYSLDAVLPGRPEAIPVAERDQGKLMLAQQSGIGDFQAFVASLEDSADIVINDDLLAADDLFQ